MKLLVKGKKPKFLEKIAITFINWYLANHENKIRYCLNGEDAADFNLVVARMTKSTYDAYVRNVSKI